MIEPDQLIYMFASAALAGGAVHMWHSERSNFVISIVSALIGGFVLTKILGILGLTSLIYDLRPGSYIAGGLAGGCLGAMLFGSLSISSEGGLEALKRLAFIAAGSIAFYLLLANNVYETVLVGLGTLLAGIWLAWRSRAGVGQHELIVAVAAFGGASGALLVWLMLGASFGFAPQLERLAIIFSGATLGGWFGSRLMRRTSTQLDLNGVEMAKRVALVAAGSLACYALTPRSGEFFTFDMIPAAGFALWLVRRSWHGAGSEAVIDAVAALAGVAAALFLRASSGLYFGFPGYLEQWAAMFIGAVLFTWLARRLMRPRAFGAEPRVGRAPKPAQPVTGAPSRFWSSGPKEKIFISYRRDDSLDVTGRLHDRLVREFGDKAIMRDMDSIKLGVDFRQEIDKLLSDCTVCIAVIGNRWLSVTGKDGQRRLDDPRDHVRIEIETALKRNVRVVPLLIGGAPVPGADELPASLHDLAFRNGTPIRPDPDFHRDVDRLIAGIRDA